MVDVDIYIYIYIDTVEIVDIFRGTGFSVTSRKNRVFPLPLHPISKILIFTEETGLVVIYKKQNVLLSEY